MSPRIRFLSRSSYQKRPFYSYLPLFLLFCFVLLLGHPSADSSVSAAEVSSEPTGQIIQQRKTYLLDGQPIAVRVSNPTTAESALYYLYIDHLGSANTLVDEHGTVVDNQRFYPFGELRTAGSTAVTSRGFTGHQENREIGLTYMNARYYVLAGRFASADTIVPNPTRPQSLNRYAYVYNNPVKFNDPSGHCAQAYGDNPATDEIEGDTDLLATCNKMIDTIEQFQQDIFGYSNANYLGELRRDATIESLQDVFSEFNVYWWLNQDYMANLSTGYTDSGEGHCRNQYGASFPCSTYSEFNYDPCATINRDYCVVVEVAFGPGFGPHFSLMQDRYGNGYFTVGPQIGSPGLSVSSSSGELVTPSSPGTTATYPSEATLIRNLTGWSGGSSAGFLVGVSESNPSPKNTDVAFLETGVYSPQIGLNVGYTFLIYR